MVVFVGSQPYSTSYPFCLPCLGRIFHVETYHVETYLDEVPPVFAVLQAGEWLLLLAVTAPLDAADGSLFGVVDP